MPQSFLNGQKWPKDSFSFWFSGSFLLHPTSVVVVVVVVDVNVVTDTKDFSDGLILMFKIIIKLHLLNTNDLSDWLLMHYGALIAIVWKATEGYSLSFVLLILLWQKADIRNMCDIGDNIRDMFSCLQHFWDRSVSSLSVTFSKLQLRFYTILTDSLHNFRFYSIL